MEISRELIGNIYDTLNMCERFVEGEYRRASLKRIIFEVFKLLYEE